MTRTREFAPAKINLSLHVTGQREDGYHLLDSLVGFASVGDWIDLAPSDSLSLTITGPEAAGLDAGEDNLVLRAARLFPKSVNLRIELTKTLPIASGIGGGSADAAAALRAISRLTGQGLPAHDAVLSLGADVPVCLTGRAARMQGIGGSLCPVDLPAGLWLVLVNPRVAVSTPAVFAGLTARCNPPMPQTIPAFPQGPAGLARFGDWLRQQRNDLQDPAIAQAPVIARVLDVLGACDPMMARMSGSGATCFALFGNETQATEAAADIRDQHPDWWVRPARLS